MTTDRDFDRIAIAWLADGPEELSDRVLDAVVDEIHVTRQRHGLRLPWRFPSMTTPARVAAAAVIGVLAIGGALYALGPGRFRYRRAWPDCLSDSKPDTGRPGRRLPGSWTVRHGTVRSDLALRPSVLTDPATAAMGVCVDNQPGCTENPADDTIRISFTAPGGLGGSPAQLGRVAHAGRPRRGVAGLRAGRFALFGSVSAPRRRPTSRSVRPSTTSPTHSSPIRRSMSPRPSMSPSPGIGEVRGPAGAGPHVPRQHDHPCGAAGVLAVGARVPQWARVSGGTSGSSTSTASGS